MKTARYFIICLLAFVPPHARFVAKHKATMPCRQRAERWRVYGKRSRMRRKACNSPSFKRSRGIGRPEYP